MRFDKTGGGAEYRMDEHQFQNFPIFLKFDSFGN